MKVIIEFVRYQYQQYALPAKYVAPLIGLFAVFQFMYSLPPAEIVSSYAIMGLILFVIMVWVGMTCREIEQEASEQDHHFAHAKREKILYWAGVIFWCAQWSSYITVPLFSGSSSLSAEKNVVYTRYFRVGYHRWYFTYVCLLFCRQYGRRNLLVKNHTEASRGDCIDNFLCAGFCN